MNQERKDNADGSGRVTRDQEVLNEGEVTPDAKGLAQVYGDADRTVLDDPVTPPGPVDAAAIEYIEDNFTVRDGGHGERYLEEAPPAETTD
ncbi:hypothetical protein D477_018931 [Arthrobacter crystallopoietes BAB-32]|uniref:Uncharacterized protein n=1 Tax=Arthrobacter crystallopoietes BAB-32 TaxID=1246476 RepID=N1UQK4_9MICC|nr:hypothetical protein [Arthrobacter crystallopoietes]EMY32671.1 hypothetical protein D477_018931 [Arthrobacter crystallopoietes BAB-32]